MATSTLVTFLLLAISTADFFSKSTSEILLLPLTHTQSTSQPNTTTHHLLKAASTRSAARHRRRSQVSLPLAAGSDYTLSFSVGSAHPLTVSLYMDTGSDLVWFPCSPFECILCEGKPGFTSVPPNISTTATAVDCRSHACASAHSSLSSSDLCAVAGCPLDAIETGDCAAFPCPNFYYAYGDGSLVARLHRDVLASPPSLVLPNFTFGCSHTALGEPVGVAGFGRGPLSLPAQLARHSPQLGHRFSYCLVSNSFDSVPRARRPSPLILGRSAGGGGDDFAGPAHTPMLSNPKHPYFYCVGLEGISIGKRNIPAPVSLRRVDQHGNGGVVVDSGTTFTMLPSRFFKAVVEELDRVVRASCKRATAVEDRTGLGPCYYVDAGCAAVVPALTLHFGGNSTVVLPTRNYFYQFFYGGDGAIEKRKVGCLMVMDGGDEVDLSGPGATLGNYQQQGFEVVYDLERRTVGFVRRECASLWETLNKH